MNSWCKIGWVTQKRYWLNKSCPVAAKSWRARTRRRASTSCDKVIISFKRKEWARYTPKHTCSYLPYNSKKSTTTAINATITFHGITRSKELIDSFYKLGMGIIYPNVLFLREIWTMHDLEQCSVCYDEINEGGTKYQYYDFSITHWLVEALHTVVVGCFFNV